MAAMDEAAPARSASPRGLGERPKTRLRSVRRTAKELQKRPKKTKAPSQAARGFRIEAGAAERLLGLVALLPPGVHAAVHVGDVGVAHLLQGLRG